MNSSSLLVRCAIGILTTTSIALATFNLHAQIRLRDLDMVTAQNQMMARLSGLSDADLKLFYLQCSRAVRRSLGSGGVALCSIGYEVLLNRTFGGDFSALLAWSRLHPDDGPVDGGVVGNEPPHRIP